MKYIVKESEPLEFTNWKKQDKMFQRGNPKWNRVPSSVKDNIRASLKKEQGYICCYCERELRNNDYHIEHFKPKDKFSALQLDYSNLICSCQLELKQGEPRHCGNSKGSWFDNNLLISPLNPNCEQQFVFTYNGHILPSNDTNIAAKITIEKLQLDIDKLVDLRKKAIEPFIELFIDENLDANELEKFVNAYLIEKENNNGRYNEFYTTIKYLFGN